MRGSLLIGPGFAGLLSLISNYGSKVTNQSMPIIPDKKKSLRYAGGCLSEDWDYSHHEGRVSLVDFRKSTVISEESLAPVGWACGQVSDGSGSDCTGLTGDAELQRVS